MGEPRTQALHPGTGHGRDGRSPWPWSTPGWRFGELRLPPARRYPAGLLNSVATAFIDEAAFRGILLGLLVASNWPVQYAIAFQAVLYALSTRLAGRGRPNGHAVPVARHRPARRLRLTLQTGGIGAAFLGHALTRFAIFIATGPRRPDPSRRYRRRGGGPRADDRPRASGLGASWSTASRVARATTAGSPISVTARSPEPVALYVHFPFCLSICPVLRLRRLRRPDGARPRCPDRRVSSGAVVARSGCAAVPGSAIGQRLSGRRHSVADVGAAGRAAPRARQIAAFGIADDAEITIEVNPGPGERGDLAGFRAAGVNRAEHRRAEPQRPPS